MNLNKGFKCLFVAALLVVSFQATAQDGLLLEDRFKVEVDWKTPEMETSQVAHGGLLDDAFGYFHFFKSTNVEVLVKVINACEVNDHFWFFAAGLTNVEVTLTVTDTQTGTIRNYFNPAGLQPFNPVIDTNAFDTCSRAPSPKTTTSSGSTQKMLGLQNNRFQVSFNWENSEGQITEGSAQFLTNTTGGFALQDNSDDLQAFVKIVDGRDVNGSFWVYLTAMVDVPMSFTVIDNQTDTRKIYNNSPETPFPLIDFLYARVEDHRWVFPWVSNNSTFGSRLIVNNYNANPVTVSLLATRSDGETESQERQVQGGGFLNEDADSLFEGLGEGAGYSVTMTAPSPGLAARWVTNNLGTASSGSPSQGVAIKFDGGTQNDDVRNGRIGQSLMFGYLPGGEGTLAAPVIVNTGDVAAQVTLYFFNEAGRLLGLHQITDLMPLRPFAAVVSALLPEVEGDVAMVAHSQGQPITGVVFTFNDLREPSLGNAETILFVPPGTTPQ